eukprot:5383128-Pleurochrysis_carterae.AAC.1
MRPGVPLPIQRTIDSSKSSQRQRRCAGSDAGGAVQPATHSGAVQPVTAALCRERSWQRCAASDSGAVQTAALAA